MSARRPPANGARKCERVPNSLYAFFAAPPPEDVMSSAYRATTAIDVHKKWLYVVVAQPDATERAFCRCRTGSTSRELPARLGSLHCSDGIRGAVLETRLGALEGKFTLLLAQARSNAAPHGRKSDYADALRLLKRLWTDDLRLSFVPDAEQRSWRTDACEPRQRKSNRRLTARSSRYIGCCSVNCWTSSNCWKTTWPSWTNVCWTSWRTSER